MEACVKEITVSYMLLNLGHGSQISLRLLDLLHTHTHTCTHTHMHTHSFSRETVQPAFLKPSHLLPQTPSPTLLLLRLQAVAPQGGQARSGLGRLTWMTTQSDEEPLPILPGNRERSNTTKASDTSLSGYVRRCGRKGQPPTTRYVVTGVSPSCPLQPVYR